MASLFELVVVTVEVCRTQRLLLAVVVVFTVSWLPLNLINVLLDLRIDQQLGWTIIKSIKLFHKFIS